MITFILITGLICVSFLISMWYCKPYTYTITCPRCKQQTAIVEVTGSTDQFESTKCICGYTKEDIL